MPPFNLPYSSSGISLGPPETVYQYCAVQCKLYCSLLAILQSPEPLETTLTRQNTFLAYICSMWATMLNPGPLLIVSCYCVHSVDNTFISMAGRVRSNAGRALHAGQNAFVVIIVVAACHWLLRRIQTNLDTAGTMTRRASCCCSFLYSLSAWCTPSSPSIAQPSIAA